MRVFIKGMPSEWQGAGSALGYTTAYRLAQEALKAEGIACEEGAKVWIHYAPPHFLVPEPGKLNIAFTMWESENIPPEFVELLNKFDRVLVPCKHNREVMKRSGVCKKVSVCNLGIDTDFFFYKKRPVKTMDEKFRFLWLSAPNMRKGVDEAIKAFVGEFKSKGLNAELYIKSTLFEAEGKLLDWSKEFSAIVDTRMISREELRELYWSADCLVYPSKGEGAGMIPMEMMSSGGVVLAPPYSGMKDYMFKEFSLPLQFTMQDAHYGCQTRVAHVNMEDLRKKMAWIFYNRTLINVYGYRASAYIGHHFSLDVMAKNFKSYLEEVCHD